MESLSRRAYTSCEIVKLCKIVVLDSVRRINYKTITTSPESASFFRLGSGEGEILSSEPPG